jgi:heat-inducible transcriptional repressor
MSRKSNQELNLRSQQILKVLVEQYIENGQPVGSKKLVNECDLLISAATARNVMAELEEKGFLKSPHTSAGRIPTPLGYRLFVDNLIDFEPLENLALAKFSQRLDRDMTSQELVESASGLLSEITQMAGVVTLPKRDQILLRHVEFMLLSEKRVLVILVLDDHEVQNRIIYTQREYNESQLREAANYINQSFAGKSLPDIHEKLLAGMKSDQENIDSLMQTTLDLASQAFGQEAVGDYVVAGQENLIELAKNRALNGLRELFQAFTLKGDILHLLDKCAETQGVQLYIGEESGYKVLDECSVVTSPYQIDGERVGVLGVIGPTRMHYDRVIPIVDATARILSAAMDASLTNSRTG